MVDAAEAFIISLARLGLQPRREGQLVVYSLEPVDGARAGVPVETGVETAELARWPLVPPHWIHLPEDVVLSKTNSRASTKPGWTGHSRQIRDWNVGPGAGAAWAAHVRGVLSDVVPS